MMRMRARTENILPFALLTASRKETMSMALACCDAMTTSLPFSDMNPKIVIERTACFMPLSA